MAISKTLLLKWMLGSAGACLAGIGLGKNSEILFNSGSSQQQPSARDSQVTGTGSEPTEQPAAGSNVAGDRAEGDNTQRNDLPQSLPKADGGVSNNGRQESVGGEASLRSDLGSDSSTTLPVPGVPQPAQETGPKSSSITGSSDDATSRVNGRADTEEQVQRSGTGSEPTAQPTGSSSAGTGSGDVAGDGAEVPGSTDQVQDSNNLDDDSVQGGQGSTLPAEKSASQDQDRSDSHQSIQDPASIQISTPQGEAVTTGTGSESVVTNTVDTGSQSGLQEPKESQTETQSPASTTTQDSGISSQPQQQQQAQEATEGTVKTSTGGGGSGGASQDSTTDDSKTDLGQGTGGGTTEGNDLQTKDIVTSDSEGKQGDKASKVEGADASSEGLQGSNGDNNGRTEDQVPQGTEQQEKQTQNDVNGGAGGANTDDGSLGGSDIVTGGQKDGGGADPAASTKQQPEQVVDGGQALQSGESADGSQKTPSVDPLPTSTTGGSEPGEGTQVQDGTANQPSQPQAQGGASTGQEGAVTVPSGGDGQPLSNPSTDTQQQAAGGGLGVSDPVVSSTGDSPPLTTDDNQHNSKPNEAGEDDSNKASKGLDTKTPTNELKEGETVTTGTEPGADTNAKTQTGDQTLPPSGLPGSSDPQTADNTQDSHQIKTPDISTSDKTDTPGGSQDVGQVPEGGATSLPKVEGKGNEQKGTDPSDQASEIASTGNTDGNNQGGSGSAQVPATPSTPTIEGGEQGLGADGADVVTDNSKKSENTQEVQQGTPQANPTKTQGNTAEQAPAAPTSDLATGSDSTTGGVKDTEKTTPPAGTTGQESVTDVSNVDQISQP